MNKNKNVIKGKEGRPDNKSNSKGKVIVREQPKKDSKSKRVNYDNERISKVKEMIDRDAKKSNANEIGWYNGNPELLRAAGSVPFASVLGAGIEITDGDVTHIPGIMVIPYTPTTGSDNIALNMCFNSMYSYVVHANSRNYRYNAPDLGMLCMAGAQIFAIMGSVLRAFGLVNYYQERNTYVPENLMEAQGFYGVDFRRNQAQIWFDINNFIDQMRQFWIPNVLPIIDRWYWMNTNVFTDAQGNGTTSQLYLYVQNAYYAYNETGLTTGGSVLPIGDAGHTLSYVGSESLFRPGEKVYSWNTWKLVIQSMIDALVNSEDRGMIFGDILNAYGDSQIKAIQPIDAGLSIAPAYNAEVLTQIENCVTSSFMCDGWGQNPDSNEMVALITDSVTTKDSADSVKTGTARLYRSGLKRSILNFHHPEQPTPEEIMIATRGISLGLNNGGRWTLTTSGSQQKVAFVTNRLNLATYGSELYQTPRIYSKSFSQSMVVTYPNSSLENETISVPVKPAYQYYNTTAVESTSGASLADWSAFDWHPFIYGEEGAYNITVPGNAPDTINDTRDVNRIVGDFDNYTVMEIVMIQKLHRTAIFSLLGVPHM